MIRPNYFSKLLISYILISVIPLLVVGMVFYTYLTNTLMTSYDAKARNCVGKISADIDFLISQSGELINGQICEDAYIKEALSRHAPRFNEATNSKLFRISIKRGTGLFVLDVNGSAVFATSPLPTIYNLDVYRNWGIFREANDNQKGYVVYAHKYINNGGNIVLFSLARAIRDRSGTILGYVIADFYQSHINEIYSKASKDLALDLILLNKNYYTIFNARSPSQEGLSNEYLRRRILQSGDNETTIQKIGARKQLLAFYKSKTTNIMTVGTVPVRMIMENAYFLRIVMLGTCYVMILICLTTAFLMARNFFRPVKTLHDSIKRVEGGDLSARVELSGDDEFGELGKSFNAMVIRINELLENVLEKQQRIRNSEIKALQAQLNPHFLYNTLDSIKWLAKIHNVKDIWVIATQLGKLLRNTITKGGEIVTVHENLEIIKSYLSIQEIRYSDKFKASINIEPDIMNYMVPRNIFQPIVENAIIHGLENKSGQGILMIKGYSADGHLIFEFIDDGIGISADKVKAINSNKELRKSSKSIGIQNVNRTLKLYYGEEYGLQVESELGKGTKVTIKTPLVLKGGADRDQNYGG